MAGKAHLTVLYSFEGLDRVEPEVVKAGEIVAVAGVPAAFIGDTLGDPLDPRPLPGITVEEPTISMVFSVNTSPLAGKEGKLVTSRQIKERLDKEVLYNVSIRMETGSNPGRLQGERPGRAAVGGAHRNDAPGRL